MVEGGAGVISSFLDFRDPGDDEPVVDIHVVTVAPMIIGSGAIHATGSISKVSSVKPALLLPT